MTNFIAMKKELREIFELSDKQVFISELGDVIKQKREELNYKMKDVAECVGLDVSSYRRIERGKSDILTTNLLKLVIVLELDLNDIRKLFKDSLIKKGEAK